MLLTLCTGNAARSVMAGVLLADAPLPIVTAGTHVVEGQPISRRTRAALGALGLDAGLHRSHQVSDEDLATATLILAMATEHVAYIRRRHPEVASRAVTLKRLCRDLPAGPPDLAARLAAMDLAGVDLEEWEDVADPAGGEDEVYLACAYELAGLCDELLPRLS